VGLLLAVAALGGLAAQDFTVPFGFSMERAADRAASYVALAFDPHGRAIASIEDGGLVWFEDVDGDGFFETSGDFSQDFAGVQGLCWLGGRMFVSGVAEGRSGLWRVTTSEDGRSAVSRELLAEVRPTGAPSLEHGAHAVVPGPDGLLYWVLGDHVELATPPDPASPIPHGYLGSVLPVLADPFGQGATVRFPAGHVVRVDPATGAWSFHSTGLRNAYDLAFDAEGELFTCDSDMEWDAGLPWYRPVRFLHLVPGGEYGWRRGSAPWPEDWLDGLPALLDVGRGSPTGLASCDGAGFPLYYDGAILAGDWTNGRILALFPERRGASFGGRIETLLQAQQGLSVTDLAFGPDGALYFVGGGRGTLGRLQRLVYRGPGPSAGQRRLGRPHRAATWLRDAPGEDFLVARLAELGELDPVLRRRACESLAFARRLPEGAQERLCARLDDSDRWVRFAARRALERHGCACAPAWDPLSVGAAERALAALFAPVAPAPPPVAELGSERSAEEWLAQLRVFGLLLAERPDAVGPEVRRRAGAALLAGFPHADRRVARAQAELLARLPVPGALAALVQALSRETDRAQRLHFLRCAAAVEDGWTAELARPVLAFLEQARGWQGGASYGGYVEHLADDVSAHFTPQERIAMARDVRGPAPIGPRCLAAWMAGADADTVEQLVGPLQYAWGRMPDLLAAERLDAERGSVVSALPGVPSPSLAAFLRRQLDGAPTLRVPVLGALARIGFAEDFPRLIEGLDLPEPRVRDECARALARIDRAPEGSGAYRIALALAQRLGADRGSAYLELVEHWARVAESTAGAAAVAAESGAPAEWSGALRYWERWAAARFPGFETAVDDLRRPVWDLDAIDRFLERSAARSGSAGRGARVFAEASCATCHVLGEAGGSAAGWGPDLAGVTRRFDRRSVLEAILFPSQAVSDQYATSIVETVEGGVHEGRLLGDDARGVVLRTREGERLSIPRDRVAEVRPSPLSSMPEGLLEGLTLEQIKDLLAFLAADGRLEGPEPQGWTRLFDDEHRNLWEGDVALWKIRGGALVGRSRGLERSAYLVSKQSWGDFELEFDVRLTDGEGNSGALYHVDAATVGDGDPVAYQADVGAQYWGSLFAGDGRGVLASPDDAAWRAVVDRSGWNHFWVRVAGRRQTIEVNGLRTVDVEDDALGAGPLAFQLHAGPAMEVRFQNARLLAGER